MMLRWAAFIVVAVCACAKQPSTTDSKVLNYSIRSEPASFDPIHSAYIVNAALQRQILECLFEYDYDSDGAELSNLLVETYEVSDSGLIYDFHLNTDAEFFDPFTPPLFEGSQRRAVTANDVLFCWLRQADARNKGEGWWAMRDTIVGLDDFHQQTLALEPGVAQAAVDEALVNGIAGLQVINSTHLQVNLVRPDPMFLNRLAMSYFAVYPHEAVSTDERSMDAQPVGSGAYFLDSFLSGQSVSMAKTPQWRLNYVDAAEKINFEVIRDNQTTIEMFKRGNTDRLTLSHLSADQFLNEQLQLKPEFVEKGVTMSDYPRSDTTMLVFNMDDPDIGHIAGDTHGNNNRRQLRKALSYAFPRQQWQQLL
jgi:peptide/nickel transport system substrate-binding protein